MAVQFFYDQQIRRFLLQFIRMVSNFQVEFGNQALQVVPVFYGDQSRQAAQLIRQGSENTMSTVPAMAVYISALAYDRDRVQEPFHISKMSIRTRLVDPDTGMVTSEQGDSFSVERLMPVPYRLTLKLDIWTSNTEQKLQLVEQLATLFNPSLEIQSTDNYIDWTSLSAVLLTDINWDSRTVPTGADEAISIATMTFELPIWISPPAKVKKLGVIEKVIQNIFDPNGMLNEDIFSNPQNILFRKKFNIMGYGIVLVGNILKLIRSDEIRPDVNEISLVELSVDLRHEWEPLIDTYGRMTNGIAEIRLERPDGNEIIGTIAKHPTDPTAMLFQPYTDTLPGNSLNPINAIIDPRKINVDQWLIDKNTGNYKAQPGTRFLIVGDINEIHNTEWADAWKPNGQKFAARTNDIIEFDGTKWNVVFDSQNTIDENYITNLITGIQYYWDGESWLKSYEGVYREGQWRLIL
jgi:hypothetical protein